MMKHPIHSTRPALLHLVLWLALPAAYARPALGQSGPPATDPVPQHASWRIVTIEGDSILAAALDWPGGEQPVLVEAVVAGHDGVAQKQSIPFDSILELVPQHGVRRARPLGPTARVIAYPASGGMLGGMLAPADGALHGGDRAIMLQHDLIGPVPMPLDQLAAIRFIAVTDDQAIATEFDRRLRDAHESQDTLLVRGPGGLTAVAGALESLTSKEWRFSTSGREVRGPLEKLAGIVLAKPRPMEPIGNRVQIQLFNGDSIHNGMPLRLSAKTIELQWFGADLPIDWRHVMRLSAASDRVRFVSDLEPTQYQFSGFFGEHWPLGRDRSPSGQSIEVAGRRYAKGLGLRPGAVVSYQIPAGFSRLAAVAVVSAATPSLRPAACTLAIDLDDPAAGFSKALRPGIPEAVQLDLGSSRTISIRIERGAESGIGAHVTLANLRLVR